MTLRIAPCTTSDLDRLLALDPSPQLVAHHRERFSLQTEGSAFYLLAWRGPHNVGRATLYRRSKYLAVRRLHPGLAEINALEADPQRQGTGSALIAAAERLAAEHGHSGIGLAVEPGNPGARRLYERLGYVLWGGDRLIDEWTELRDDGSRVDHRDPCDYLIKPLLA